MRVRNERAPQAEAEIASLHTELTELYSTVRTLGTCTSLGAGGKVGKWKWKDTCAAPMGIESCGMVDWTGRTERFGRCLSGFVVLLLIIRLLSFSLLFFQNGMFFLSFNETFLEKSP